MRQAKFFTLAISLALTACGTMSIPVVTPTYYEIIGSNIYYQDIYERDPNKRKLLSNVDLANFTQVESSPFALDASTVYFRGEPLPSADPQSFSIVSRNFAKDKNSVYLGRLVIKNINSSTFKTIENSAWGTDGVYASYSNTSVKLCDPESFRIMKKYSPWAHDKKCIYHEGEKISLPYDAEIEIIDQDYLKTKAIVFFKSMPLTDADPITFRKKKYKSSQIRGIMQDKNGCYFYGGKTKCDILSTNSIENLKTFSFKYHTFRKSQKFIDSSTLQQEIISSYSGNVLTPENKESLHSQKPPVGFSYTLQSTLNPKEQTQYILLNRSKDIYTYQVIPSQGKSWIKKVAIGKGDIHTSIDLLNISIRIESTPHNCTLMIGQCTYILTSSLSKKKISRSVHTEYAHGIWSTQRNIDKKNVNGSKTIYDRQGIPLYTASSLNGLTTSEWVRVK